MKKKAIQRGLLGFPIGISIGHIITIIISLFLGSGNYYPIPPELISAVGSEIGAVVIQVVLSGLFGASCAAASVIWEIEDWSIAKQTGIHFSIISMIMLPIAYFAHWIPRSLVGFLMYFGAFVTIFVVVWVIHYYIWRNKIKYINKGIEARK